MLTFANNFGPRSNFTSFSRGPSSSVKGAFARGLGQSGGGSGGLPEEHFKQVDALNMFGEQLGGITGNIQRAETLAGKMGDEDLQAGIAGTDTERSFATANQAQQRGMSRQGVDPSSGRRQAMDQNMALAFAKVKAGSMTGARRQARERGLTAQLGMIQPRLSTAQGYGQMAGLWGDMAYGRAYLDYLDKSLSYGMSPSGGGNAGRRAPTSSGSSSTGNYGSDGGGGGGGGGSATNTSPRAGSIRGGGGSIGNWLSNTPSVFGSQGTASSLDPNRSYSPYSITPASRNALAGIASNNYNMNRAEAGLPY